MSADTPDRASAHPALTIEESKRLENALFTNDESLEWPAMQRAGRAIADGMLRDFFEIGRFPENARILVLVGKGHNGGDALIAAQCILEKHPHAQVSVCFAFGERTLKPLAFRAWREISGRVEKILARNQNFGNYDLCLDGIFGFQFRPPVDERIAALIKKINSLSIHFRAAVDLPSGLGGTPVLRADFTYATGIVKTPVLEENAHAAAGRVRYIDLGFFASSISSGTVGSGDIGVPSMWFGCRGRPAGASGADPKSHASNAPVTQALILTPAILDPLRALRAPQNDKRDYGHLFIIGGSRKYPGAILMSALAALHSGVGLVTVFAPESIVPACAARVPEAIWQGMAESPDGGLALEDFSILRERLTEKKMSTGRATALLIGPGLSRDREAQTLVLDVMRAADNIPVVIDADALQSDIVAAGSAPRILTPHTGEFGRIYESVPSDAIIVRKGPLTRIQRGGIIRNAPEWVSLFGGPVLARGGSGDLLAGLIGGLLAQAPHEPLLAACRGVVWHGMAADCLARAHGQHAVRTTQLLDFLPKALRGESKTA